MDDVSDSGSGNTRMTLAPGILHNLYRASITETRAKHNRQYPSMDQ